MTVNIQIPLILPSFHFRSNHPNQPDQPQQMIGMLMTDENLMDGFHRDLGFLQLRHDPVSASGINQKIFLSRLNGKTGVEAFRHGSISCSQYDQSFFIHLLSSSYMSTFYYSLHP